MSSSDKTQARGEEYIPTEEVSHDQSNSAPVADSHRLCSSCLARLDRNEFTQSLLIATWSSSLWACFRWGIFSINFLFSQVTLAPVSWLKKLTSTIQEWGWKCVCGVWWWWASPGLWVTFIGYVFKIDPAGCRVGRWSHAVKPSYDFHGAE